MKIIFFVSLLIINNAMLSMTFQKSQDNDLKILTEAANSPLKKIIFKNKNPDSIVDLEWEDDISSESFSESLIYSLSKNNLLIIAKVVTLDSKGQEFIKYHNAYYFIAYLFKDKFLERLSGKNVKESNDFFDPVGAKIIRPIEFYYIDRFDKPKFEYIGEIPFDRFNKDLQKVLKIFFISNIPSDLQSVFKISRQKVLRNRIKLSNLKLFIKNLKPTIAIDSILATNILLEIICEVMANPDLNQLKYKAFFVLYSVFIENHERPQNKLEEFCFIAENVMKNLRDKGQDNIVKDLKNYLDRIKNLLKNITK